MRFRDSGEGAEKFESDAERNRKIERAASGRVRPIELGYGDVDRPDQTDHRVERRPGEQKPTVQTADQRVDDAQRNEMRERLRMEAREAAYGDLVAEFEARVAAGQSPADILINFVEPYVQDPKRNIQLRESEKRFVRYATVTDPDVSAVAGMSITRPVFTIVDPNVYKEFERIFRRGSGGASHGLVPQDIRTNEKAKVPTRVILARAQSPDIVQHEIFHTADRNIDQREGYDNAVAEIVAYFQDYIVRKSGDWMGYEIQLTNKIYYDAYALRAKESMTYGDYVVKIRRTLKKVQERFAKVGAVPTQQSLERAKTLDQILSWK